MAIRKQLYTWELYGDGTQGTNPVVYPAAGVSQSILYGAFGNVQAGGQTGLIREDQFVVIDKIASKPGISPTDFTTATSGGVTSLIHWPPNMFVNIVIDTTGYYQDPQNVFANGVSGTASPYPQQAQITPYYDLWPPIYVLPDQTIDIRYTLYNDIIASSIPANWNVIPITTLLASVYVEYTNYSGTDAVMARKLMNLGVPITPSTVDNFRRLLLENKGLDTETFSFYLKAVEAERKRENKQNRIQGLDRHHEYGNE